jgi:hypothetical protein
MRPSAMASGGSAAIPVRGPPNLAGEEARGKEELTRDQLVAEDWRKTASVTAHGGTQRRWLLELALRQDGGAA